MKTENNTNQNAHDANRTRFGLDSDGCINPNFFVLTLLISIALCLTNFYF